MDSNQIVPSNSVNSFKEAQHLVDKSKINQKLADELLSLIFEFCLPHSDPASPNSVVFVPQSDEGAPFTLLFVCHRWRVAALASSRLWRNIQAPSLGVNQDAFTNKAMSNQLKSLRQWLSFSRDLPLSIKCVSPSHEFILSGSARRQYAPFLVNNSDPNRHVWNVLLVMIEEERRWTAFDVVFDHLLLNKFVSSPQFKQPSRLCTNLTYLNISYHGLFTFVDISNVIRFYNWIKKLPALQTLVLREDRLLGARWLFQDVTVLPFQRVPKIEFSRYDMSATDGAQALSLCVNAQDVRLWGQNPFSNPEHYSDMMSIRLPQTFANMSRLSMCGVQFPTVLISQSTFPVLEHLEIVSCMEPTPTSAPSDLSRFLRTSGAPLKELIIHSRKMSVHDAFSILSIPALQLVPCVDLCFEMSSLTGVNSIMTDINYQWFRDGPDFIVWKYNADNKGSNFGWKVLDDEEILEWELKQGTPVCRLSDCHGVIIPI